MCGIVAYLGEKSAEPILIEGLKRLEYRGYDSAGIAVAEESDLHLARSVGRISCLQEMLDKTPMEGTLGGFWLCTALVGLPSAGTLFKNDMSIP